MIEVRKDLKMECIWVGLGGAIGSILRYFLSKIAPLKILVWENFPIGTLAVNLIGSFLIGFLGFLLLQKIVGNDFRLFFIVGILGGFTTFSSLGLEAFGMLLEKDFLKMTLYILVSNILGIMLVGLGWFIGKYVLGIFDL